ncbi:Fibroblast growth factor receptor substrate 2 [Papilio xuthus]|uniref:Fibroblast growth factor receptor substrate 2 n=1 Tax=Papilio xuthus TaxID=66420 RepID=A0A194PIV6_PAPXU|nr:Fibroblast growth factor receptor substrate 2 [Papilio xuthus]
MGCLHSKKEVIDLHPNIFRVMNIDDNGEELCTGQLEITESDIVLYREGRDSTVWPLHSLRRYGFEAEIFSFESGRRCETGEGIYAFRCRRASILFRTLQQQIQLRNVIHDSVPYPVSRLTPSPQGRQTLQASVVHRSSIDNGQVDAAGPTHNSNLSNIASHNTVMRNATQSPRSPSSADILEVMPLNPRPQAANSQVTNVYQVRDFKREHNNNQDAATSTDTRHVYSNDISRDLAVLRNTLRQETALNTMKDIEDETRYLESRYINGNVPKSSVSKTLSPTLSSNSEHYAQLSIEQQEAARLYVNVAPADTNLSETEKNDPIPTTPLTPKQVEYCNLTINNKQEINSYANLLLGEIVENSKNLKPSLHFNIPDPNQKFSESDTFTSLSPVEELEVNYAILDIDSNKDCTKATRELVSPENQSYTSSKHESTASHSSQTRGRLVSQNSFDKTTTTNTLSTVAPLNVGYTTIDFDKTVALTSVASGDISDCSRKTRHNSCSIACGSPAGIDKTHK